MDLSGNELAVITDHIVVLDIYMPKLDSDVMTLYQNSTSPETIEFTLSEEINLIEGANATGFSVNEGTLASAVYSGKGSTNTITVSSQNDGEWNAATTLVTYSAGGNILDFNNLEMSSFTDHTIIERKMNIMIAVYAC